MVGFFVASALDGFWYSFSNSSLKSCANSVADERITRLASEITGAVALATVFAVEAAVLAKRPREILHSLLLEKTRAFRIFSSRFALRTAKPAATAFKSGSLQMLFSLIFSSVPFREPSEKIWDPLRLTFLSGDGFGFVALALGAASLFLG